MGGEGIFSLGLPFKKKKFSSQFREKSGEELNFLPSPLFMSVASLFFLEILLAYYVDSLFIYLFVSFLLILPFHSVKLLCTLGVL